MKLTQERLKVLFDYDKLTGVFDRLVVSRPCNRKHLGKTKGHIRDNGNGNSYYKINVDGKSYYSHRLAWLFSYGYMPSMIDHIDGDGTNNSIINLREADYGINSKNKKMHKNNTTGFVGVHRTAGKYKVDIQGKLYGYFCDLELAGLVASEVYADSDFHKNHGRKNT